MSQIDERLHYDAILAVEDDKSKIATSEIIRLINPDLLQRTAIISIGPASNVISLAKLSKNREFPMRTVGILDGDINIQNTINCIKIPSTVAIEKEIFDSIKADKINELANRLGIDTELLNREFENSTTSQDFHSWNRIIAERLKLPEEKLWGDMVFLWANKLDQQAKQNFVRSIQDIIISN